DAPVRSLAARLCEEARCGTLILKLSERGTLTCRPGKTAFALDSFTRDVVDAVGAGDALLAFATLTMITGGSEVVASILGSFAAAHECEVEGNVPVSAADV